jgi:hypothetical protein
MTKNSLSRTDLFGITASTICAVHCIATPIAIALLPHYIGEAWESPFVHQLCAGFVALFCLSAAYQGYRKHNDWRIVAPLALGLFLVVAATFLLPEPLHELYETPVLCFGSFALVAGHLLNIRRLAQCCRQCEPAGVIRNAELLPEATVSGETARK